MISPILVDLGWELSKIGFYIHIVGYSIGVVSAFGSSFLIEKFGKKIVLIMAALGQTLGLLLYLVLLNFPIDETFVTLIVAFIFALSSISSATLTTLMMDKCSNENPATQFAMQHALMQFSSIAFSGIAVSLAGSMGYENVVMVFCTFGLVAVFVAMKLELKKS